MTATGTSAIRSTYSSYTYDSPNAVKRALHRHRYRNILKGLRIHGETRVLDYGAGDGRLFRVMIDECGASPAKLIAFDPVPAMRKEFSTLVPECSIFGDAEEIKTPKPGEGFDFVFCCEVFEHLTGPQIEFALAQFMRLSDSQTVFVIEVPIEIGPVGLTKNLYRRFRSGTDISAQVMLKALVGFEQLRQPRLTTNGVEILEHPGYSFATTRRLLSRIMTISVIFNDPFRHAPFVVNNSQIMVGKRR